MSSMKIGQLAKQAGVGVPTIRFYERRGLLPLPPRQVSGYRQYSPEIVRRVRFIRHAKELGFSLSEITELLSLQVDPQSLCGDVRMHAAEKLAAIEEKVCSLNRMRRVLEDLVKRCSGDGPTSECPIIEAMDAETGHADS